MPSLDESVIAPVLPGPVPRRGRLPLFEFFRTLRDNMIATYAEEAYERDIVERKIFGRSRFLVNEPAAIKHVLLDNAANYQKTEITRRILEPGLGRGLITSEGETWRRHRRTMSPAFDHRSIVILYIDHDRGCAGVTRGLEPAGRGRQYRRRHGNDGSDAQHHLPHHVFV